MKHYPTYPSAAAFPVYGTEQTDSQPGLSKREYFAAVTFQGLLADTDFVGNRTIESIADYAVKYADALIVALNKEE